jgi:outer membrane lipoprotein-sorting protein
MKIFLPLLFFCYANVAFAQKEAKAKELLDRSSAAFSNAGNMSVYFTINIKDSSAKQAMAEEGVIDIKGNQFHINTPDNEIWFNGKTQWVLQKSWEEVNISEPSEEEVQLFHPGSFFTLYKKASQYRYLGEKTDVKMRKVHEIELIPQDKKSGMKKIILQINTSDRMPMMFHIYYANQIENLIYINKYQTELNLPDSLFVFDAKKHPEAEIIDTRIK